MKATCLANGKCTWNRPVNHHCMTFQYYGIPQHFGLFYAMGGSLIMEGLLSACYHICPNNSNYQFGKFLGLFAGKHIL